MASQAGGMEMSKLTKLVSQWGCQKQQCAQTCSDVCYRLNFVS